MTSHALLELCDDVTFSKIFVDIIGLDACSTILTQIYLHI